MANYIDGMEEGKHNSDNIETRPKLGKLTLVKGDSPRIFSLYVDEKFTIWARDHYHVKANSPEEAVDKLYTACNEMSKSDDIEFIEDELLHDTLEGMDPAENEGYATLEVYCDDNEEYTRSNKSSEYKSCGIFEPWEIQFLIDQVKILVPVDLKTKIPTLTDQEIQEAGIMQDILKLENKLQNGIKLD